MSNGIANGGPPPGMSTSDWLVLQQRLAPAKKEPFRFEFRSAAEMAKPRPPIPMIVPELGIGPGRPALLSAYSDTGKTILAIDVALAVAAGRTTAWGKTIRIARQGMARWLDYEMGPHALDDRTQRQAWARKIDLAALEKGDRLGACSFPRLYLSSDTEELEEALTEAMRDVVLCVVDNLGAATPHNSDRNSGNVRVHIDVLTRVSNATGCTFLLIAHDGKGGGKKGDDPQASLKAMRNSSEIADAGGTTISAKPTKDGAIKIIHSKGGMTKKRAAPIVVRLADVGKPTIAKGVKRYPGLAIKKVDAAKADADDDERSGPSSEQINRAMDRIRKVLNAEGSLGVTALVREAGGNRQANLHALKEMREEGIVVEAKGPRGSKLVKLADDESEGADDQVY